MTDQKSDSAKKFPTKGKGRPGGREPGVCSFCGKLETEVFRLIASTNNTFICNECITLCNEILEHEPVVDREKALTLPTPEQLKAHLDLYVIGQERAKRALCVALYNHYKRLLHLESHAHQHKKAEVEISKSNILLIGPTGSGKTLLAQTLARALQVPFVMADATTLTEAGYVGEDVENIISKLLAACDGDIDKAQRGIVFIDEIDKISRKSDNPSITRDVSGEGVQQALLKLIEGTVANVPPVGNRKVPNTQYLRVDTTNILFICGGAFAGLEKVISQRSESTSIGFNAQVHAREDKSLTQRFQDVQPEDLIKYGLIPEIIGRLPVVATLEELDEASLVSILTQPKNALLKQYTELLLMEGVHLEVRPAALRAIAAEAIKRKTGARGLRSILEQALMDTMYTLPSRNNVHKVIVEEATITQGLAPRLQLRSDSPKVA